MFLFTIHAILASTIAIYSHNLIFGLSTVW